MELGQLLASLGPLHHRGRVLLMVDLGHKSLQQPEVAALLAKMRQKGPYLRSLALFGLAAAGQGAALVETALGDAWASLRRRALREAARLASPEEIARLLDGLGRQTQHLLLRQVLRRGRAQVLQTWAQVQSNLPLELLPYLGEELLQASKAEMLERGHPDDWRRAARYQPQWAAENVLGDSGPVPQVPRLSAVFAQLLAQAHPAALTLWRKARELGIEPRHLPEKALLHSFSEEMTLEALRSTVRPDWAWDSVAGRLSLPVLRELLDRGWLRLSGLWWSRRSSLERSELWERYRDQMVCQDGKITPWWLWSLPSKLRLEEARFQCQLPALQLEVSQRCQYMAMLDYQEALEQLQPWLGSSEVAERGWALAALTSLGRIHPEQRGEILKTLVARAHEADPARLAFLRALADLPPKAWGPVHFKSLGEILKALMAAADASAASYEQAERLVLGLVAYQPTWSAAWLGKLLLHWGRVSLASWSQALASPGAAEGLREELDSVLAQWLARERFGACLGLFSALGPRLRRLPELSTRLIQLCLLAPNEIASRAASLFLARLFAQAQEVLPGWLAQDPSWSEVPAVRHWVHRQRQDLLEGLLSDAVVQGKFASGRSRWVLTFEGSFWSWTPDLQNRYAQQLSYLLSDKERDFPALRQALNSLARLALIPPEVLQRFAALSETRTAVRDQALRCLARVEGGQGVPALVEALQDERARIAIYALRRSLLQQPPQQALERLLTLDSSRVTVSKEVMRLLGDLEGGIGLPHLQKALEGELHRDVRTAALRGLWGHLDQEEIWPYLEQAAASSDRNVGRCLAAIPEGRCGAPARLRLQQLLLVLARHSDPAVRYAVLARLSQPAAAGLDSEELLELADSLLEQENEGRLAAAFLFHRLSRETSSESLDRWRQQVRQCLPRRRALQCLTETSYFHGGRDQDRLQPLFLSTLEVLTEDPACLVLALQATVWTLPLEEALSRLEHSSEQPQWTVYLVKHWGVLVKQIYLSMANFDLLWQRWGQHEREFLRWLSSEALISLAGRFGWTPELRSRLRQLQSDPSPLVRAQAEFVFPPESLGR